MSTTARPSCSTPSGTPTWWPGRRAASPSTSAPTRSRPRWTGPSARSPSSTPRVTRPSPPCVPAAPRPPTWWSWWWRRTTASSRRPPRRSTTPRRPAVPIVVAVNKIDKEGRTRPGCVPSSPSTAWWPRSSAARRCSWTCRPGRAPASTALLEAIVLTADAELDLRANPDQDAQGVAIEAHLDKGRGPVATVLVQRGTLQRRRLDRLWRGVRPGPGAAGRERRAGAGRAAVAPGAWCSGSTRCPARATTSWSCPTSGWRGRSPSAGRPASAAPCSPSGGRGSPWRTWSPR